MKNRIEEMAALQDETNSRLNPEWRKQGWNFLTAARVEAAEALDHLGYKWWKPQEPDLDQARMELVDIWHFMLSMLAAYDWNPEYAELCKEQTVVGFSDGLGKPEPLAAVTDLMNHPAPDEYFYLFGRACVSLDLSFDELHKRYIGKAALNRFRWDNGYGTTYRKIWNGREDNEHLTEILATLPSDEVSVTKLTELLTERYASA